MKIRLLTITHKVPDWLQKGFNEYAKRLPAFCNLELIEIPAKRRLSESNLEKIMSLEAEKMLAVIKPQHLIIALDKLGQAWTTEQLSVELNNWCQQGRNVDLLIGGPEGLSTACLKKAHSKWSLSPLTFPHTLVRLIIAEQIYRACSILQHHPYHR